jgi:hypothetical protein
VNRLYYSRFELKRMHTLISKMSIAPPHLADRLESLFRLQPSTAAEELEVLVTETHALVAAELPDLELAHFVRWPDRHVNVSDGHHEDQMAEEDGASVAVVDRQRQTLGGEGPPHFGKGEGTARRATIGERIG